MVDSCRVTRKGDAVTDSTTGVVAVPEMTVYEGKAKRQTYEGYEAERDVAGHSATIQRYAAHFPIGSFVPAVGDVIEWLTSQNEPDMAGTKDRVAGLFNKSFATAQRVFVDELVD